MCGLPYCRCEYASLREVRGLEHVKIELLNRSYPSLWWFNSEIESTIVNLEQSMQRPRLKQYAIKNSIPVDPFKKRRSYVYL